MPRPPVTEGADMRGDDDLGHDQPPEDAPHAAPPDRKEKPRRRNDSGACGAQSRWPPGSWPRRSSEARLGRNDDSGAVMPRPVCFWRPRAAPRPDHSAQARDPGGGQPRQGRGHTSPVYSCADASVGLSSGLRRCLAPKPPPCPKCQRRFPCGAICPDCLRSSRPIAPVEAL